MFLKKLETINLVVNEWKIVDASFIEVTRQRNNREENKKLKNNEIPEEWKNKPRKLSQKDTDARWTKKNNQNFFGFKNHVKIDSKSKIITKFMVTTANVHDSQTPDNLLDSKDKEQGFYADNAYAGKYIYQTQTEEGIEIWALPFETLTGIK